MKHFPAIAISVLLFGLGLGLVGFGTLGLQGKLSRKPPTELFPDMDRQPKLRPQEPNRFFPSGVSSQLPPDSAAKSTITAPGRIVATVSLVTSRGALRPGIAAVVMTMSAPFAAAPADSCQVAPAATRASAFPRVLL